MTAHTIIRLLAGLCLATLLLCSGSSTALAQPAATADSPDSVSSPAVIQPLGQGNAASTQTAVQGNNTVQGTLSDNQALLPRIRSVETKAAALGDELYIQVDSATAAAIEQNLISYRNLELFLDGMRFHSIDPYFLGPHTLVYPLVYDDSSRAQWRMLLGSLKEDKHTTRIGMGFEGGQEILPASLTPGYTPTFTFVIYRKGWFVFAVLGVVAALVLFWLIAVRSDIIRDSNPPEPRSGERRPYSLARFQMAVWFFVVIISYLFIFLLTGQYNDVLNDESLILMGIGAGTALGAAMIDSTKNSTARTNLNALNAQRSKAEAELGDLKSQLADVEHHIKALSMPVPTPPPTPVPPPANAQPADGAAPVAPPAVPAQMPITAQVFAAASADPEVQELIQNRQTLKGKVADAKSQVASLKEQIDNIYNNLQQPVSEGFLRDILTDHNGISFHRFQILMWTIVLVAIFVVRVYQDLLMPEFSATMLALMGISSGTYLGFKFPEQQTQPVQPTNTTSS